MRFAAQPEKGWLRSSELATQKAFLFSTNLEV
jgi:hypothetical protein